MHLALRELQKGLLFKENKIFFSLKRYLCADTTFTIFDRNVYVTTLVTLRGMSILIRSVFPVIDCTKYN